MHRKGIILAGGSGSRLAPITNACSKQLLPVYDKPMIYYPLSALMLSGIREIAIITTPKDAVSFQSLLGSGRQWGLHFTYLVQEEPRGLAEGYLIAKDFLSGAPSALILGDNIFHGAGLRSLFSSLALDLTSNTILGYQVSDPERYGVVGFNQSHEVVSIVEKPKIPASDVAITGFYFLDPDAPEVAASVIPSDRGELEITSVLEYYLSRGSLKLEILGRGIAWLDTGTNDSLFSASSYIRSVSKRQGIVIGSPEEIAFRNGWITEAEFAGLLLNVHKSEYGQMLKKVLDGVVK